MSNVNLNMNKGVLRDIQKRDGFFDGRFCVRKVKNKKREANRKACRGKVRI
jgi:hypothetical protein